MSSDRIQNRLVLHFTGYEAVNANQHYERFARECAHFRQLWEVEQEIGPLEDVDEVSAWQTRTTSSNWSVSTKIIVMEWRSYIPRPHDGSFWQCVAACSPRYLAHYLSLAPIRYFKNSWPYALYFVYPVVATLAIAVFSYFAVATMDRLFADLPAPINLTIGIGLFAILFRFLAPRWSIPMALDVSQYTHSMARQEDAPSLARIDSFAAVLGENLRTSTADEIAITSHSYGSVFAAATIAKVLRQDPNVLDGRTLTVTAIASNMLKIGLMDECQWLRDDLKLVLGHEDIQWIEVYGSNDVLCFSKSGPADLIDIEPANPVISKRVRLSAMIDPKRYKSMRGKLFRLHRQFIMANQRRYFFDFYLLLFGPQSVTDMLRRDNATKPR